MMKKYNKPEIVTLALDMVDVIETSGTVLSANALVTAGVEANNITKIETQITEMNEEWHW